MCPRVGALEITSVYPSLPVDRLCHLLRPLSETTHCRIPLGREALSPAPHCQDHILPQEQGVSCSAWDPAPHCFAFPQTCLSIPDIKTAFSDCTSKIGRRDCLTQACSALTG